MSDHGLPTPTRSKLRRRLKSAANHNRQLAIEQLLKRHEIALARSVKQSKNRFIAACADAHRSHREREFHTELLTHRVEVKMLLAQQARVVIPHFSKITTDQIRGSVKSARPLETKRTNSLFDQLIAQWLAQRQDMASSIAQTTLNDVLSAVQTGIDAGDGGEEIARSIGRVTGFSPYRSLTVARTETHGAALFAQLESARDAERTLNIKLMKEWLPTLDARTRDAHAAMAGVIVPMDGKFIVGGVPMDRPGDPAGGAANCCNCRCSCSFSEARD